MRRYTFVFTYELAATFGVESVTLRARSRTEANKQVCNFMFADTSDKTELMLSKHTLSVNVQDVLVNQ